MKAAQVEWSRALARRRACHLGCVALLLSITLVLSGCAAPKFRSSASVATVAPHQEHAATITALTQWRLRGRLAVQRGDKGFSADLDWREAPAGAVLRVMAPLNGGTFSLTRGSAGVTLVTPKGASDTAPDAEELMLRHLGWSLPLAGARYWVLGVPAPDAAHPASQERIDERGRWTDFAQDGWRISILEYAEVDHLSLPRRLYLSHTDLQVRIAMKQWEMR